MGPSQLLVGISFPGELPSNEAIVSELEKITQARVSAERNALFTPYSPDVAGAVFSLIGTSDGASVDNYLSPSEFLVETDNPPTYFQWAVVLALQRLGGTSTNEPPAYASKPLSAIRWWHTSPFLQRWWRRR
ncbi:hypothetical protein [Corallococcus exercitus]|uniref:Uncharacterized protein n=1 Tax=Corallococcus exercitus TaxID=2316736 RepID=A0A7Y4NTA2_9BACT|nr:hypothetical protein [Corallococcus exercitus]NOK35556.1 hypothetical protein [Corallococcus exercitus]